MKRKVGILSLVPAIALMVGLAFYGKSSTATGLNWRIATETAQFAQNPCPVEIVKITRADGKSLPLNEGFRSTEEALDGTAITVRNTGNKQARKVSLVFYLVDQQNGQIKAKSSHPMTVNDVAAMGEKSMAITAGVIGQMKRLSEKSGVPLTQLRLNVDWAELSDSTRWMLGQTLVQHPDPDKSFRWYPQEMSLAMLQQAEARKNGVTAENAKSSALWCECCHLAYIDFLPCFPEDTNCRLYEVAWQNYWYSPLEPGTFNIDQVYTECAPGCYSTPWEHVSNCIP